MVEQARHRLAFYGALMLLLGMLVACAETNDAVTPLDTHVEVTPPNTAPSCAITAPETDGEGSAGAPVYFEATVSDVDEPADWLSVTWESDKDGVIGNSTPDTNGSVTFATSELSTDIHTISMRVSDPDEGTCTDSVVYTVRVIPPSIESVTLGPDPAFVGDTLICGYEGFVSPMEGPDLSTARWTINDLALATTDSVLSEGFSVGDTVTCTVTPDDGFAIGTPLSDSVLIDEVTPRRVVRTRIVSDTWRDLEYDVDTGELWFIGEKSHGLDYFTDDGNDLWWCYMNTSDPGSGLLEFLMTHDLAAAERKAQAVEAGWTTYEDDSYSFLPFEPLAGQQTFVNLEAPETPGDTVTTQAYTNNYAGVENEGLFVVLYHNAGNGHVYLGMGGAGLSAANLGTIPPGDGSPNRDNGLRTDVAYKITVALSEEARQALLEQFELVDPLYDDSAIAYDYQHPAGL